MLEGSQKPIRCEHPGNLKGRTFLELRPEQFCDQPLILHLSVEDVQAFSISVRWQTRNHSGLYAYQVVYRSVDGLEQVSWVLNFLVILYFNFYECSSDSRENIG